ncbi:uncharacterized protein N7498_005543 [Penicillium cinerascens]|uniref:IMS import disulfide relay-system CHCH-CHCH-like Cx9C domain-containing protein n=1 Tax=Penicillium cinerascens TaxID=70096 RepID=A0A9W9T098_9EURO|nr:uncharacterized protein N7498_005543 [Penicillium cinerascens]KAJ5204664.1 hypothetical protein N7498_005543 [Penicillium cinerascens]
MPARTRPVEKFAKATAQCSVEAAAYGKCVVSDYNSVHKDMCAKEFMRLKDCFLVSRPGFAEEIGHPRRLIMGVITVNYGR